MKEPNPQDEFDKFIIAALKNPDYWTKKGRKGNYEFISPKYRKISEDLIIFRDALFYQCVFLPYWNELLTWCFDGRPKPKTKRTAELSQYINQCGYNLPFPVKLEWCSEPGHGIAVYENEDQHFFISHLDGEWCEINEYLQEILSDFFDEHKWNWICVMPDQEELNALGIKPGKVQLSFDF